MEKRKGRVTARDMFIRTLRHLMPPPKTKVKKESWTRREGRNKKKKYPSERRLKDDSPAWDGKERFKFKQ